MLIRDNGIERTYRPEPEPPAPPPPPPPPPPPAAPARDGVDPIRTNAREDLFGPSPGYTPDQAGKDAEVLHEAIDHWGTDEDAIWRTLGSRSKEDIDLIRAAYRDKFDEDMEKDLRDDLSPQENLRLDRALLGKGPITPQDRAELDFKKFDQLPGPGWPHAAATFLKENAGDKAYQARLIELMKEGGQNSKLHAVVSGIEGLFVETGAGEMRGSQEDRQIVLDALKAAREAGTFTDADLQAGLQRGPSPWGRVREALGVTAAEKPAGADGAVEGVKNAVEDFEDARAEAARKDEWLGKQLATFGPALTDEQKQKYIQAYRNHPDNKGAYEAVESTAAKLADKMKGNTTLLEQAAFADPEGAGVQYRKALETLADSSQATLALELGARYLAADPQSPMGQVARGWNGFDQMLEKALPNAASTLLATEPDADAAFAKLQAMLEPYIKAIGPGAAAKADITDGLAAIKDAKEGKFDRLQQLTTNWEKANPVMKGLASAGLIFGAVGAAKAGKEEDYYTMSKNILGTGEGGARMTAQILQSMSYAGEVSKGAAFAAKLSPGLGVLANGAALAMHSNQFVKENNPGYLIAAVGDFAGMVGSALELSPLAPAGLLVSGVGAAITAIGEVSVGFFEKGKLEDERDRYLEAAGLGGDLRETLMDANHERVRELVDELKIPPAEVQELVRKMPFLLTMGTHNGLPLDNTVRMLKAYGISGSEAARLLGTMGAGHEDPQHTTGVVLMNLAREAHFARSPEDFDRVLTNLKAFLPPEHAGTIEAILRAGQAHRAPAVASTPDPRPGRGPI